jgi:hypothetical protein
MASYQPAMMTAPESTVLGETLGRLLFDRVLFVRAYLVIEISRLTGVVSG